MADLDDFFAKKDKKKSKVVKKYTTSELLSSSKQQQEDVAAIQAPQPKKPAEAKKAAPATDNSLNEVESQPKTYEPVQEEEWGEFEQEKERDYSGLKIQKLQIQDYEEDDGDYEEQELNEEGEVIRREPVGPWNKSGQQPSTNVKVKEPAPVEVLPNTTGGVYIPPSKRMGSGVSSNKSRGKKEKGAPDLSNESNFPSLSAAVAIEQNAFKLKKFDQQERGFIEQKPSRSQSSRNAGGDEGPRLHLGNKFHALSNDDN